jgi:hypothetical protein
MSHEAAAPGCIPAFSPEGLSRKAWGFMPACFSFTGIPAAIRGILFHARFRQLLLWCLPALVAGVIARGWVLYHFPYGYVHPDSADFLITAEKLLDRHHIVLHGKKAFLAPFLFALPLLFRLPSLLFVPWAQHLFGLGLTLMVGELVRLWTTRWKLWIIPATTLATLNPALLWYEHTLISEFQYLWCLTALLLAGTACARWPSRWTFALLLGALLLTAGARPEGKLYVCFCLLLVLLIHWGAWKKRLLYGAIALIFCTGTWLSSRNTQAGILLYATVLPLAPDVPGSAPGFATWIDPLRKERIAAGTLVPDNLPSVEKKISTISRRYLQSIGDRRTPYNRFCQRLAVEAALHRPFLLPVIALNKALLASHYPVSGDFGPIWMQDKQVESCTYKDWMVRLMPRLAGPRLARDPAAAAALQNEKLAAKNTELFARLKQADTAFVQQEYAPLPSPDAFTILQRAWTAVTTGARVCEQHYPSRTVPGIPIFFILAATGMVASICRPGPLRRLHLAWLPSLGFVFTIVMLTAPVLARYRFVFEPFCLLYIFVLLDSAMALSLRILRRYLLRKHP